MRNEDSPAARWARRLGPYLVLALFLAWFAAGGGGSDLRSQQLGLLGALLAMHVPALCASWQEFQRLRQIDARPVRDARPGLRRVALCAIRVLPRVLLLAATYDTLWTLDTIGIHSAIEWQWSLVSGFAGAAAFRFVLVSAYQQTFAPSQAVPNVFRESLRRQHLLRGRAAQFLASTGLVLIGPVLEEAVYRGFFVYFAGALLGDAYAMICLGLVLSIWLHLYMGPDVVLSVALFYGHTILLLYSPFGLLSAMAFHIALNAHYLAYHRNWSAQYVKGLRKARVRKA